MSERESYQKHKHKSQRNHRKGGHRAQEVGHVPQPQVVNEIKPQGMSMTERMRRGHIGAVLGSLAVISSQYPVHHTELLSSYGKDFLGPALLLNAIQIPAQYYPPLREVADSKRALLGVYTFYVFANEGVKYLTNNYGGQLPVRFDPWNFVAFAAGLTFAMAVEKFIIPRKK